MTDSNPYARILEQYVNKGIAVLTAGSIHPNIPTIHDVGHSLATDTEVRHIGFGCLTAKVLGQTISFDGGGAMNRERDAVGHLFSWTTLSASQEQLDEMGYDLELVGKALGELAATWNDEAVLNGSPE